MKIKLKIKKEDLRKKLDIKDPVNFVLEGEQIIEKINDLPLDDDKKIDAKHIKNLPKSEGRVVAGAASRYRELVAGDNITIVETKLGYPTISATSTTTDISGLVPYTGATTNVDLGDASITSYGMKSTNTITIQSGKKFIFDG